MDAMGTSHRGVRTCQDACRYSNHLTDKQGLLRQELVLRNLQVQRRRAFAHAARSVIVAAMAWAEPAMVVTSIGQRHTPCNAKPVHCQQLIRITLTCFRNKLNSSIYSRQQLSVMSGTCTLCCIMSLLQALSAWLLTLPASGSSTYFIQCAWEISGALTQMCTHSHKHKPLH